MTQHLRIIWALLKKNNSHPGMWTSLLVFGAMFLNSAWDYRHELPLATWLLFMAWVLLLATSTGAGSFGIDLKNDALKFLEYLPIRRWHIWFANILDGLFWLTLMILAGMWPRLLYGPPASAVGPLPDEPILAYMLFDTRWTLFIGSLAMGFCAFAASAYTRLVIEKDSAAIFRAVSDSYAILALICLPPFLLGLTPTLHELAMPLLAMGLLLFAASAVQFMLVPREWGRFKRWALVRVPTVAVILAACVALTTLMCYRWSQLRPGEPLEVSHVTSTADGKTVFVSLRSNRSGEHLLAIDRAEGRQTYLGRGVSAGTDGSDGLLSTPLDKNGLRPRSGTIWYRPGADPWDTFLPDLLEVEGIEYYRSIVMWSAHPRVMFVGRDTTSSRARFFVADHLGGQIRRTIDTAVFSAPLVASDGRILLAIAPSEQGAQPQRSLKDYVLYDPAADSVTPWRFPGHLIAISEQFDRALCVRVVDGKPELLVVETPAMSHRVVAGANVLEEGQDDYRPGIPWSTLSAMVVRKHPVPLFNEPVHFIIDPAFRRLVFRRTSADGRGQSLELVDLQGGESRTVLGDNILSTHTDGTIGAMFSQLRPFSVDGESFVYDSNVELVRVYVRDGRRVQLATHTEGQYRAWFLSPSGMKVMSTEITYPAQNAEGWTTEVKIWTDGEAKIVHSGRGANASWLDDEQLLITSPDSVNIVNVDTEAREQVYATGQQSAFP